MHDNRVLGQRRGYILELSSATLALPPSPTAVNHSKRQNESDGHSGHEEDTDDEQVIPKKAKAMTAEQRAGDEKAYENLRVTGQRTRGVLHRIGDYLGHRNYSPVRQRGQLRAGDKGLCR
jgi:hypothetical protein